MRRERTNTPVEADPEALTLVTDGRGAAGGLSIGLSLSVLLASLAGCAPGASPAARPATRTEPEIKPFSDLGVDAVAMQQEARDEPLYVAFGRTLIVPADRLALGAGAPARAKLDDERDVALVRHRVGISALSPATPQENVAIRWMGGLLSWNEAADGALDLVEVRLPVDAFGHWLWIGDRRVRLEWLGEEKSSLPRAAGELVKRAEDPFVRECLRLEAADPRIVWRARLFGVTPATTSATPIPFAPTPSLIESPDDGQFMERLAEQTSTLWRVALAALASADENVGRRVVDELTLVVEIEFGARKRMAPAWATPDEAGVLLSRLLEYRGQPRRLIAVANEWLRSRPVACAWVSDDAGLLDGNTAMPLVRVGVANLGSARALVSAKGVIDAGAPEIVPLQGRSAATLPIAPLATPAPEDGSLERWGIDVRCGDWAGVVEAQRRHLIALPPGLPIGALALDHASSTWTRSAALVPVPSSGEGRREVSALVGRLVRDAGPGGVGVGSGWSLYLEAERSTSERQTIRVWFGNAGAPSAIVTAELPEVTAVPESGEGSATVRFPGRGDAPLAGARVVPGEGRWTVRLPIPNSAIERPGRLRLAIEHVRSNVRSTWPRAQFPWQTEPGRASVDLTKW